MTQVAPAQPVDQEALLSSDFVRKLDRLDVLSRKLLAGKLHGERRSKRKGRSVEFADYRPYTPGDDPRFIDWNLYARLDRLFTRLFMEEEDLSVSVLLDVSASMDWGTPNKLLFAKRLAAALGYIGLAHYNRVHFYSFADTVVDRLVNLRGRGPVGRMLGFLGSQRARGGGDLAQSCRRFALTQRGKGVVVIVSDFFDKGDLGAALRYLSPSLYDVYAIQLLSPDELDPRVGKVIGDLKLVDCEDGAATEVSVTAGVLDQYTANLRGFCRGLRGQCLRRGVSYMMSDTSVGFDTLVLRYLRERGLLR